MCPAIRDAHGSFRGRAMEDTLVTCAVRNVYSPTPAPAARNAIRRERRLARGPEHDAVFTKVDL